MRLSIWFLVFCIQFSYAQTGVEKTISGIWKTRKASEAKSYLLHLAVLETLKEKALELKIDFPLMEKTLDQKFSSYFETLKQKKLKGMNEAEQKKFLATVEDLRREKFIAYARLADVVDSYAFKSIENDPAAPDTWKASLVLNIDPGRIERFRNRVMADDSKVYTSLYLLNDINLYGLNWADLALDGSASFRKPLSGSWLDWLSSNQPSNVYDIQVCEDLCIEEFSHWQQLPQDEGINVQEKIQNALWLRVSYNIHKIYHSTTINEWTFEWDGRAVLLDANTKKILHSQTLSKERKTWRGLDQKSLNSALASGMYRSALPALTKMMRKVQVTPRLNRLGRLGIQGHKNMGDVLSLMESLRKEGVSMNLELQLDLFTPSEAQVLAFYQGEEKTFIDLLSRLKELKSSQSYRLVSETSGIHPVLKLVAE